MRTCATRWASTDAARYATGPLDGGESNVGVRQADEATQRPDAPRRDRLRGEEAAQVVGQLARRLVAIRWPFRHRLEDDRFEVARNGRIVLARPRRFDREDLADDLLRRFALER